MTHTEYYTALTKYKSVMYQAKAMLKNTQNSRP